MTTLILGQHPGRLDVRLVEGDGADLVGTLVDTAGAAIAWPGTPALEFAGADAPVEATVDGSTATWSLTVEKVAELAAIGRPLMVRLTLPDDGDPDGRVLYAGRVSWSDGWSYGDRTQRVTFTLPGGPPGPKGDKGDPGEGGGSSLVVVNGGAVELDDQLLDGTLVGYRVTAPTIFGGGSFGPGTYIFERDTGSPTGWTYRVLAEPMVVNPPDSVAPTPPELDVDNAAQTELVATFGGGTDAGGVTQYRTRIDGGAWSTAPSPRTFAGLAEGSAHTIDAQAGDAAGNWSASTTWAGSTASGGEAYDAAVLADAPTTFLRFEGNTANAGSSAETYAATGVTYVGGLGDGAQAADFDGSAKVQCAEGGNQGAGGCAALTVEAIVSPDGPGSVFFQFGAFVLEMVQSASDLLPKITLTAGGEVSVFGPPVAAGTSHHLAAVWDGATVRLYVDGVSVGNPAAASGSTANYSTFPPSIGGGPNAQPFNGRIDGLAVYRNVALSAGRVMAHAQAAGVA